MWSLGSKSQVEIKCYFIVLEAWVEIMLIFNRPRPGAASLVSVFLPRCFLVYIFVDISHIFEVGKALRC